MADIQRIPRNGLSIQQLANRIGRSTSTVKRYTSEPREVYETRAAERHARIRELRSEGLTMRAIAEQVGVTVGAVHYAIHKPEQTPE